MKDDESDSRAVATECILRMGLDPAMRPDPAFVIAVFIDTQFPPETTLGERLSLVRSSPGLLGATSTEIPLGGTASLADRLGLALGQSQTVAHSSTLIDAVLGIDLLTSGVQISLGLQTRAARFNQQIAKIVEELHAKRMDGARFPDLTTMRYASQGTAWGYLAEQGFPTPHVDSLTGVLENLQFVCLSLRNYNWVPRDLFLIDARGLVAVIPEGTEFSSRYLSSGVDCLSWRICPRVALAANRDADWASRLINAGFEVEVLDDGMTTVRSDTNHAFGLGVVIGPSCPFSPPLDRLVR